MRKLIFASIFTFGTIFSLSFGIIVLIFIITGGSVNLWISLAITITVSFILWLIIPKISDLMYKWLYKVTFLSEEQFAKQHPLESEIIKSISTEYKFPFPRIGIIPDKNPTAFTYGSARFNARIVLTDGIFTFLNTNEIKAVLAHELGHVVNRDMVMMTIASTLVQILYEIYYILRSRHNNNDKKANPTILISFLSYIFYIIGTYLLLLLSRIREYSADLFSAKHTNAQDLSSALIKISYGILTETDTGRTTRLLNSTRHLGIIDVKNIKYQGAISYVTNSNPDIVSEVVVFDIVNPWAKISELSSTHPLTGKRLNSLKNFAKDNNQPFPYNIDAAIERLKINKFRLYSNFFSEIFILSLPFLLSLLTFLFLPKYLIFIAFAIGLIINILYKFQDKEPKNTTILEQMRDPYASPIRGKLVSLSGEVIGKGIPGYIFSEDMMYKDNTGLILLDYKSSLGSIGNLIFAIKKVKKILALPSNAIGWFYRGLGSTILLKTLKTNADNITIKSHPILWKTFVPVALVAISILLYIFRDFAAFSSLR